MGAATYQLVCDNMVLRDNGRPMIVESMFSAVCDLASDHGEILARIHPVKKQFFDLVHAGADIGTAMRAPDGRVVQTRLHNSIQIYVNKRGGDMESLDYAVVTRSTSAATGEAHAHGFDAQAEPLIRQMPDRSFRLVFCSMPPRAHKLGDVFDMDHFGDALIKRCKADIRWDDRDVFWISSKATADDIREVLAFLKTYDGT
jgi:hypothetical protein